MGTGIGPLLARRIGGSGDAALRTSTACGFLAAGIGYLAVAGVDSGAATWVLVLLAHTGGSTIWVSSTTLWQRAIDDGWRGRVVTLEQIGLTLAFTLFGLLTGAAFDQGWAPGAVVGSLAAVTLVSGGAWAWAARPWGRAVDLTELQESRGGTGEGRRRIRPRPCVPPVRAAPSTAPPAVRSG